MKILYNDLVMSTCALEEEEEHVLRHSAAHIMAQAVSRLYPEADFGYGPATENGFYYDIDFGDTKISEDDLPAIEDEMKKIVKREPGSFGLELRAKKPSSSCRNAARFKVEHIGDPPEDARITFYQQGDYIDMCVGPHICHPSRRLKAFKLTAVPGAYRKNDANNKMLTRINGVAFRTKEEMAEHFRMLEEAEKRDHRKIGKEMELFMMDDAGPGFPFWLPNGMRLKNALMQYWMEMQDAYGYEQVDTPIILSRKLWETSGHWDHYKANMYTTSIDDEDYAIADELPGRSPDLQEQAAQLPRPAAQASPKRAK